MDGEKRARDNRGARRGGSRRTTRTQKERGNNKIRQKLKWRVYGVRGVSGDAAATRAPCARMCCDRTDLFGDLFGTPERKNRSAVRELSGKTDLLSGKTGQFRRVLSGPICSEVVLCYGPELTPAAGTGEHAYGGHGRDVEQVADDPLRAKKCRRL